MVRESRRIRVVLFDVQLGLVVEQPVEDVGGIADRSIDHLCMEGRILIRNVGVKLNPWFRTVFGP